MVPRRIPCRLEKFHDDLRLLEEFRDSGVSRDDLSPYYTFQGRHGARILFLLCMACHSFMVIVATAHHRVSGA